MVDVAVGVVRDPLYVFGVRELRHDGGKLLAAHVLPREHLQPIRLEVGILDDALALFVKPLHCHAQLRLREAFTELLCNCLDLLRTDRSALVLNPYHKRSVCSCRGGGGRGRGTLSKMPNARFKSSADVCSAIVRCPRGGSGHCPALREWPLLHAHLVGVLWGPRWLYPVLLRWLVAAVGALGWSCRPLRGRRFHGFFPVAKEKTRAAWSDGNLVLVQLIRPVRPRGRQSSYTSVRPNGARRSCATRLCFIPPAFRLSRSWPGSR